MRERGIRKSFPKSFRIELWNKYNQRCAYCGCKLEYKNMQIDHKLSVYKNDRIFDESRLDNNSMNDESNLLPSCRQCNFYKGVNDIESFRTSLTEILLPATTRTFQFRLAEKYGLVKQEKHHIRFYFETLMEGGAT